MPVESATYLSQLVSTNPTQTDGIDQGYQHLQLIKSALQATFPNLTGAVTASQADLNSTTGLLTSGVLTVPTPAGSSTTGGSVVLKGAGAFPDITLQNASGSLQAAVGATQVLTLDGSGNATLAGWITALLVKQAGYALMPSGVIVKWSGAASAIPSGWLLCDGTSGTPNLVDKFVVGTAATGSAYVVGQTGGAASATPTTAAAGSHQHTGNTGSGGGQALTASTDTQGAHSHTGSAGAHTLTVAEIPAHSHEEMFGGGTGSVPTVSLPYMGAPSDLHVTTMDTGGGAAHTHGISTDGAHQHNVTVSAVSAHTHPISLDGSHQHTVAVATLPPFYALCFIMKS